MQENQNKKTESFSKFFIENSKPLFYKKGEIVIRPDDRPTGVYFIEKGYVRIYSITDEGEEKIQVIYKAGEIFPLLWAISNIHKDLFYEAVSRLTLRRVTKDQFNNFVRSDPQKLIELTEKLAALFDILIDRIKNLEVTKSYYRLIDRLLFLTRRFGLQNGNTITISAPITQKDIANSINMTRETASRDMSELEKKKLISYSKHLIVINDINKLREEFVKVQDRRKPL